MLFRETVAVYYENSTEYTLCGQTAQSLVLSLAVHIVTTRL